MLFFLFWGYSDPKIPCVYIHVYRITKTWGLGPYNSLHHADNRRYFLGLSLTWNPREAHVLVGVGSGKIWTCSCWEKGNFTKINEFRYGRTWKIWPSLLSLSLYNPIVSSCPNIRGSISFLKFGQIGGVMGMKG